EIQGCSITTQGTTVQQIRESLIEYKPGEGLKVPPCGIEITAGATFVLQGTPNANNAGDDEASTCDAAWSSDIFIQKAFDDWGQALIHLEPGQGQGAENQLLLYSNVNRDQNDTNANIPITELWYEHYLFNKQIAITAGKMDPANYIDQNQYAHDETTQFLGRMFKQNPAIEWPDDNTLAGRLIIAPEILPYLSVEATYFDADNDWEHVFDRPFLSAQLNLKPSKIFNLDQEQWDGNYRFYWWLNGRDHSKLVAQDESPADDTKNINTGFGFSLDQMVTDVFGVFARFGWQKPDLALASSSSANSAPAEASWSSGMQMTGKYWKRPDDIAAFGIGQVFPKEKIKNMNTGDGGAAEGHLEVYYKCQLFKWLAITPDFQWIWNPRGINESYQGDKNTIFVYGVRGQIDF
ncbi:MAG: carbohydrate porin, partial [Candidatus Omnitrophica bacterium]|nr:carbohydrate porin [Candidatus Omnitrophota bacterium]